MKHKPKELGLISLDRLEVLKGRVLDTIEEYKSLLKSLEMSFSKNDSQSTHNLQNMEVSHIQALSSRVKIFYSHIQYLKKNGINCENEKSKVNNELNSLKIFINSYRERLIKDRDRLSSEISSVNKTTSKLSKYRDITATRIDIIT